MVNKPGAGFGRARRSAAAAAKAGKAPGKRAPKDPDAPGRLKQIGMVAGLIRKSNPRALWIVAGAGLGVIAVFVVVGLLTGVGPLLIPAGVPLGVLAAMILFGRFAQAAQYSTIAGQPGAAVAIAQNMRGNWTVTPAIAGNRNMDVVHRVVGRPGVILIGEGSPSGLASLLAAEKKRISRVAYEVPIFDIQVGETGDQLPIRKLQRHLMKLPRNLKPGAVRDLNSRLKALPPSLQAPRGPLPKSGRMPKPPRPKVR
jgi:hypothetical protein